LRYDWWDWVGETTYLYSTNGSVALNILINRGADMNKDRRARLRTGQRIKTAVTPSQCGLSSSAYPTQIHSRQIELTMKASFAALTIFLGAALAAPTATAFPTPASSTGLPAAKIVPAGTTFDGKMVRYSRSPDTCQDQTETDEAAAMFIAEDGATIKNVILSKAQAEGIHCRGACTLENVWWEDVCEDAATFKQPAGKTSYVIGGGAKGRSTLPTYRTFD
jgi:hypothetical protein